VQPSNTTKVAFAGGVGPDAHYLAQEAFHQRLHLEQKRTERSERPFVLVLLESPVHLGAGVDRGAGKQIMGALLDSTRATDTKGWYRTGSTLGVIFTELGSKEPREVGESLIGKLREVMAVRMDPVAAGAVKLSFCVYPGDWDKGGDDGGAPVLYPEIGTTKDKLEQLGKRFLDISGSVGALLLGAPVFLAVALGVKMTSKGPVLYRQRRVGRYGREFTFLKFRSMEQNSDPGEHRTYVQGLIKGSAERRAPARAGRCTSSPRTPGSRRSAVSCERPAWMRSRSF
jgi:hypothetical protein